MYEFSDIFWLKTFFLNFLIKVCQTNQTKFLWNQTLFIRSWLLLFNKTKLSERFPADDKPITTGQFTALVSTITSRHSTPSWVNKPLWICWQYQRRSWWLVWSSTTESMPHKTFIRIAAIITMSDTTIGENMQNLTTTTTQIFTGKCCHTRKYF